MAAQLSSRLRLLLDQGLPGQDFWDVCCDHGYLGEQAISSGCFAKVHFVDCVPHIIASLKLRLDSDAGYHSCRAEELEQTLTGTVFIAGVGGFKLIKILSAWDERGVLKASRIVLNPLTHVAELRQFLHVWTPYTEGQTLFATEKLKQREIIVLQPT